MATANPTATRTADPAATRTTRIEKGMSLARGPALILGTILLAAGLFFLYHAHSFPPFSNFPNGTAHKDGEYFFGLFAANGWTGMLTAVAGGLLLFGAAQHLLAKTMSLIVGVVLAAAALIAVFNSGNVLGMAAANGWTELGWAVCAVILLFNTLIPRRRREVVVAGDGTVLGTTAAAGGPVAADEPVATRRGHGMRDAAAGGAAGMAVEHERDKRAARRDDAAEPMVAPEGAAQGTAGDTGATTSTGAVAARTHNGEPLVTREDGTPVDGAAQPTSDTQGTRPMQQP